MFLSRNRLNRVRVRVREVSPERTQAVRYAFSPRALTIIRWRLGGEEGSKEHFEEKRAAGGGQGFKSW
jgi:hypothetical protein